MIQEGVNDKENSAESLLSDPVESGPGVFPPGPYNAITDVPGVMVGHTTIKEGDNVRTGVTGAVFIGNALFQATTTTGMGVTYEPIPIDRVKEILKKYGRENSGSLLKTAPYS